MKDLNFGRVLIPDSVLVQQLAGESVLLNLQTESYYGLDDVGTRMWAALTAEGSVESALRQLEQEFDVEPDRLRDDMSLFIERLSELGLLLVER